MKTLLYFEEYESNLSHKLCFYRNVVKDSVDKIINWFKK
mgnify:CR=1 FL=1